MANTIGIGRRIGTGELLSSLDWPCFRAEVRGAVLGCNGTVIAEMEGSGEWEGVAEPCACLVFDSAANLLDAAVRCLTGEFSDPATSCIIPLAIDPDVLYSRCRAYLFSRAAVLGMNLSTTFKG